MLPRRHAADPSTLRATVGRFLGIRVGTVIQVGVVTNVSLETNPAPRDQDFISAAQIDLIGEIHGHGTVAARFNRGVTDYPAIGDPVITIGPDELRLIFNVSGAGVVDVGTLQQNTALAAYVNVNDMLSKHFAILGTTGVGKSSSVAFLVDQVTRVRPDLRVLILDVHNEYGRCFGPRAQVLNPANIRLPFWLFNFEEIVDVFFAGRPAVEEEVDVLAEVIPLAKAAYAQYVGAADRSGGRDPEAGPVRYTADVPLPYRIVDLVSLLDARMGKLENRASRMIFHKLIARIESACNDPRYAFMFENANVGGDIMEEVLSRLFRLPINGVPVSVIQLAGFPSEVVDALVSVVCRMAFDLGLWSDGHDPLLVVCEEAHRYMSADKTAGFGPTRRAVARIAKEGRKYNVFLGLVSQRPAELDATILSQCSTLFAMRLTNDRDQELLRSSVSDTAANLLSFLPSLGTGEVFAFGEGVSLPTRFKFRTLPAHLLPRSEITGPNGLDTNPAETDPSLGAVIQRWRGLARQKAVTGEAARTPSPGIVPPPQPVRTLDPDRYKLLKKPIEAGAAGGGFPSQFSR
ncbi:MAG: ATP-binding protein [Xanthobacteraceae bacterium]|nr:ATP-binding protein [Xanthobacteraceae bacterium]